MQQNIKKEYLLSKWDLQPSLTSIINQCDSCIKKIIKTKKRFFSVNAEKAFDNFQNLFIIKTSKLVIAEPSSH